MRIRVDNYFVWKSNMVFEDSLNLAGILLEANTASNRSKNLDKLGGN